MLKTCQDCGTAMAMDHRRCPHCGSTMVPEENPGPPRQTEGTDEIGTSGSDPDLNPTSIPADATVACSPFTVAQPQP